MLQHVQRYQQLAAGAEVLESQLPANLCEYLNAEIVLQTIKDVPAALYWVKSTFLYVRVRAVCCKVQPWRNA